MTTTFCALDEPLSSGAILSLGEGPAHHARVKRLEVGAPVVVVDGRGQRVDGTLLKVAKTGLQLQLGAVETVAPPPPVHLLVPIADRDRMLWLAEKCTELAATSWRPVLWRRSRSVRPRGEGQTFQTRVRARMASALEQCGGTWLPAIYPDTTLDRAVNAVPSGTAFLLDPGGEPMGALDATAPVTLAIGPEGGFADEERFALTSAGFQRVRIAGNILRFETAGVAALAIARAMLQRQPEDADVR
jgi:16S rRNA (uracil1498-N3)-methyltransferase